MQWENYSEEEITKWRGRKNKRICTCGHNFNAHTEYGYVPRHNGPRSNRCCKACDCWTPKEKL